MRSAAVAGTFDVVHDGHWALLNEAFRVAGNVLVGITSDEMANSGRERDVRPFDERKAEVRDVCRTLKNIHGGGFFVTREIDDPTDALFDKYTRVGELDYLVISPEQKVLNRAREINEQRIKDGLPRLQIVEAPLVTDDVGRKISSTNVRKGIIDKHGGLLDDD